MVQTLFMTPDYRIGPVADSELDYVLNVYKNCEDFLALGPVPNASMNMVVADINHSRDENGIYCGIWDNSNTMIGIIDFIPNTDQHTSFLSLLMISKEYRNIGVGTVVETLLESHLKNNYQTSVLRSGVQINNQIGIRFWGKCGFIISEDAQDLDDGTIAFQMYKDI